MRSMRWLSAAVALTGTVAACSGGGGHTLHLEWQSAIDRDHPLTGRIYDVEAAQGISWKTLASRLAETDVVLLAEQHDNPDHHVLQSRMLAELISAGRRPGVLFEQLDFERQPDIDAALAASVGAPPRERAGAIARAVEWSKSGWPAFDLYRPIFETALLADLPMLAANLSRRRLQSIAASRGGHPEMVTLTSDARASLAADITESHCGHATPKMVETMIRAQRLRDDAMAQAVAAAVKISHDQPEGDARGAAVLICGFGHARTDYGAPLAITALLPGRKILSVGLVEVASGEGGAAGYAEMLHAKRLPFDYVVFTPRLSDDDPCRKFRAELEKMHH